MSMRRKRVGDGMGETTKIRFKAERACFTDPVFKVDRFSYPFPTPSAAAGMLKAIYWHRGCEYVIDRIYICKPVDKFYNQMTNEKKTKLSLDKVMNGEEVYYDSNEGDRTLRNTCYLIDVEYIIEFHVVTDPGKMNKGDSKGKFTEMIRRRAEQEACYTMPYMGLSNCICESFSLVKDNEKIETDPWDIDMGKMFHSFDYESSGKPVPRNFIAYVKNGVVEVSR